MAAQNFKIKNGLTIGSTEVLDSSGDLTAAALGTFQQLNNTTAPMHHTIVVTVVSDGGNKYAMDGNTSGGVTIRLMPNIVYRFDQSHSSNSSHPLRFSETSDGTHNSGAEISDGYTIYNKVGTPGSAGAYVEVSFDQESNATLYTYCVNHSGMGQTAILGMEGDVTAVTAGTGLTGGGASGDITVNVIGGDGITANANDVALSSSVAGTNLSYSSGVLNTEQELTNTTAPYYHKVAVTVISDSGNKYSMDGNLSGGVAVRLMPNIVYRFDQSDSSNSGHPLRFSETSDGTHNSGAEISDGFILYNKVGTPGSAGAYTEVAFDQESNDTIYSYCSVHSGMGQTVTLGYAGDITGVTAGSGLTGGGTAGTVALSIASGDVTNAMLANSSVTVNGNAVALGASTTLDTGDISESGNLYFTDARVMTSLATVDAHVLPTTDNTYDLGSASKMWKDVYIGPGSLYVNGQKVVEDDSGTITISADSNQNVSIKTAGSGDVELDPTGTGVIQVKGTLQIEDGTNITNSGGNPVTFANTINVDSLASRSTNTDLTLSGNGTGKVAVADALEVSGTITGNVTGNLQGNVTGTVSSITNHDTDSLTEGSSNLYLTNERIDDRVAALIVGGSNITSTYDDAAGTLTLAGSAAYGDANARQAVSVTDSGGDGALAYNNSTGVITYTGPSASDVRAHITAGTGVGISSGQVSIGQAVATSDNVQFANLVLSGNLTVNGTTSTVSSTNTTISDALIELGNGTSGSPSNDAGFVIERGSSDNVFIGWDESADAVTFGTGSFTGASTGNLTITPSAVNTGALTISNASNSGGTARNVYQSTSAPTGGDGAVGDLWILYS